MNTGSPLAGSSTGGGRPPVALIAGPTASGKSERAVELALALGERGIAAVIVNADSAQVYADLHILSARPDAAQMRGIPHRLFGHRDGAHPCSAADWAAEARAEIRAAHAAGAVPILVGGTGLYLRTLIDGIAPVPAIDPAVRTAVRALPVEEARARLAALDPQAAARLAPADVSRTARALEVVLATGRPLAQWQSARSGGIGTCIRLVARVLVPPRERLYERADSRFLQMLELGGEAEVARLLDRGLDPALPVMRAIGVQEIAAWLNGHGSRDAMIAAGQQATRRYAKRQYTWFRNQPPQEWRRVQQDSGINEDVEIILRNSWLT